MPEYFYGSQSEQFAFYRIPKLLFTDPDYCSISVEAKILYGLLLDRMSLSAKNGWMDAENRVYIIFTIEEIMAALGCADNKATKLLRELDGCGLIERKRQGLGKPSLIYVMNFVSTDFSESRFKSRENHDSGIVKTAIQEPSKSRTNKTDNNNTEFSKTDPFLSSEEPEITSEEEQTAGDVRKQYQRYFRRQLGIDTLIALYPDDTDIIQELLELIVDTVCSNRQLIRIAGDDKPAEVVRSRFMKLDADHIRYVLTCLKENTADVRNIRQYLLAALYNASLTMSNYYNARVQHDMKNRFP